MKNPDNSILQKSLKLAKEMEFFILEDLMKALPTAKKDTLKRYITAMLKNGNIERNWKESQILKFISDKPIKTKIGE